MMRPNREGLERLARMADNGELRPAVGQTFSLHEAASAHQVSESGHARGKIVIVT
jgi:NADPH:quinone reductase-like Zn-dependent oxidoreductase